jgi:asparagine synthase (glutamine-hydrolysing)
MCGLGGWFASVPRLTDGAQRLQRLLVALQHRGPDGMAQLEVDHVGFAHTRLALIDLAGGDQPMWSACRRAVIVFNGEIFNYRQLRELYQRQGYAFASQSDTEVILAGYLLEGPRAVERLRGMFAFALWDTEQRRGLLVRDALGIKPLFMARDGDGLRFASEAKGLLALAGARARLDPGALHLLLNFRYPWADSTLFAGVRQLAPGECLEWRPQQAARSSTWVADVPHSELDIEAALLDSVQAHLVADVPVGCYLSGGIDSGVIAAMAQRCSDQPVPTFTLAVGDDPNEARNAAATAAALGLENEQAALDDSVAAELGTMLWHLEAPKVNSLQLFRLARLARARVKAVLSGLGGDELFGGYNAHRILAAAARLPNAARLLGSVGAVHGRLRASIGAVPFTELGRALEMGGAVGDWPAVYGVLRNVWDRPAMRQWLYGPRLLDCDLPDALESLRARWPQSESPLHAMLRFEWREKMVNDLLWQEDRASMAAGLEVRVPMVDVHVRASVDSRGVAAPGKLRLREVAAHYLPRDVLQRPKSGFQLDAPEFFDAHLRGLAAHWLDPTRVRDYGVFRPQAVAALLRLPVRRRFRWHFFMLYLMIQTHIWIEIFERGRSPDTAAAAV